MQGNGCMAGANAGTNATVSGTNATVSDRTQPRKHVMSPLSAQAFALELCDNTIMGVVREYIDTSIHCSCGSYDQERYRHIPTTQVKAPTLAPGPDGTLGPL